MFGVNQLISNVGFAGLSSGIDVKKLYDEVKSFRETALEKELNGFEDKKQTINRFKSNLRDLCQDQKVYIFIDELDRCKPTFSIKLLERIKHFFNIQNMIFIIATDKQQLVHSINSVYGQNFDSYTYLNRFFDQTYTIPEKDKSDYIDLVFKDFNDTKCYPLTNSAKDDFKTVIKRCDNLLSLRDIQQCFIRFNACINGVDGINAFCPSIVAIFTIIKHIDSYAYQQIKFNSSAPLNKPLKDNVKLKNFFETLTFKINDQNCALDAQTLINALTRSDMSQIYSNSSNIRNSEQQIKFSYLNELLKKNNCDSPLNYLKNLKNAVDLSSQLS